MVRRMFDESLQVFAFRGVFRNFRQQFFQAAIDLRVPRDLRQQRTLSRKQHGLGYNVDDLPGKRFERLRLATAREQA